MAPSGKLTDTWAKNYSDFPNAETFSHVNGNIETEKYEESIYVGYRYFDSFRVDVEYPFGYGLSYTEFALTQGTVCVDETSVHTQVTVTNTGDTYKGKEVVQIYVTCPQDGMPKEYKRLCGFAKTDLLAPGESQEISISFPAKAVASFDEENGNWTVEKGLYGVWAGNSSAAINLIGTLQVAEDVVLENLDHICPLQEDLEEIVRPEDVVRTLEATWQKEAEDKGIVPVLFAPKPLEMTRIPANELDQKPEELVAKLTDEEMIAMVIGEVSKGQDNALGAAGIMVPGAAGETSGVLEEKYDVPGISMADGPAGVRLIKKYDVNPENGQVYSMGLLVCCIVDI